MSFEDTLTRYADLIVRQGMNVQPRQLVNVAGEIHHIALMRRILESAYKAGAKHVSLEIIDPISERVHLREASDEGLSFVPQHFGARLNEIAAAEGCNVRLTDMDDPRFYAGIDPKRISKVNRAKREARKFFYDVGINQSRAQWCVAAGATEVWGKHLFPDLPAAEALMKLWDTLFFLCRVDQVDYLKRWREHDARLHHRAEVLNTLNIRELHFTGGGTDLKVGLSPLAFFGGGTKKTQAGRAFTANLPTEEVFTTPDYRSTTGVARVTRPVEVTGTLVENLALHFKDGIITSFEATKGKEAFEAFLATDEGARRLGEVALVGIDSPVYQTGIVFNEILLDENACCHIAVGNAYQNKLRNGEHMGDDELAKHGVNKSSVHTDFMISSEEVSVAAVSFDGTVTQIIDRGSFVI